MMTYQKMLDSSKIVSTRVRTRASQGLLTGKRRIRGIVYFCLLAIYTLYSNLIIKDIRQLGVSLGLILINLITFCILTFMSKSIFSKQHVRTYKFVTLINKVCKLLIFVVSIGTYIDFYHDYIVDIYGSIDGISVGFWTFCYRAFKFSPIKAISFIVSLIIAVPVLLYFIIIYIKIIPPICFIFLAIWFFSNPLIFYEYEYIDETRVKVKTRMINLKGYAWKTRLKRFLVILLVIFLGSIFFWKK